MELIVITFFIFGIAFSLYTFKTLISKLLNKNLTKREKIIFEAPKERYIIENGKSPIPEDVINSLKNNNSISTYTTSTTSHKATSKEEFIKILQENNISEDIINNFKNDKPAGTYTTSTTSRKVIYENGQIVSEENNENHNTLIPLTNCPNCGAKIVDKDNPHCEYCNSLLTKYIEKKIAS